MALGLRTKQSGFTLAEIMTTLGIAAITASFAMPMMNNLMTGAERSTLSNDLVTAMHAARSQAIVRNEQVTVCPSNNALECTDAEWQDGLIWFVDNDKNRQVSAGETLLGSLGAFDATVIRSKEFERFLVFRPNGSIMVHTVAQNSGELMLCARDGIEDSRILVLSAAGKPQVFEIPDPEKYSDCDTS